MIFFLFFSAKIFANDKELAKGYLIKAYNFYKQNNFEFSKEYLDKSYEYSKEIPEYYYLSNALIKDEKKNFYLKSQNADKIAKNIDNLFLIDKYDVLKQTAFIYGKIFEFQKSYDAYKKIFLTEDKDLQNDYLDCIKMLFNSNITKFIQEAISEAKNYFQSLDLYYYDLLYKVKFSKIDKNNFRKDIERLIAGDYSSSRVLYLQILYNYNLSESFKSYSTLKTNNNIEAGFKRLIIFAFLEKIEFLNQKQILSLTNDWIEIDGNSFYLTDILLKNKIFNKFVSSNKDLKNIFLNYSGVRIKDSDIDGNWEEFYQYKDGILLSKIIDANQDGINEYSVTYFVDGRIKEYFKYKNINYYEKYNFNHIDKSVDNIEIYKNDILIEKYNLLKSAFFPEEKDFSKIELNYFFNYVDTKEEFTDVHSIKKYSQNQIKYELIDSNNNGYFEYKKFYDNNKIYEAIKDVDENKIFEIKELYKDSNLVSILYKTNDSLQNYDYIENIKSNSIEKLWDFDKDGIFEVLFTEDENKISYKMFDINFDNKYDFVYQLKNNIPQKLYEIKNKKWILLKTYKSEENSNKNNWNIVSFKNIDNIYAPDSIDIKNNQKLEGMFTFRDKKFFFENGIIKCNDFNYKLFIINNEFYLIDISR
ncbi:MAG: hypothetical protein A2086_17020 [Spirochaetes bacterium GWD1_27_9]|nr:MAG: hypothetical protein A2Z98_15345 [Spirochaetes bacterium GWB1_27_13]OHD33332.1 MAG: hypothetical protein A2086_17020 [Spirochaetes bacterium GWD1_27_9]